VPDEAGPTDRAENVDQETPNADKRTDETMSRVNEPAPAELHQMCADEMAAETSGDSHQRTD
jgi:hypothetical protein